MYIMYTQCVYMMCIEGWKPALATRARASPVADQDVGGTDRVASEAQIT
jgi:hypothetical protein